MREAVRKVAPAKNGGRAKPALRIAETDDAASTVGGRNGSQQEGKRPKFTWKVERGAAPNYRGLGELLAATGNLYRHHADGHALVQVLAGGKTRLIAKGDQLAPVIVDRVRMTVTKNGKTVSELPTAAHLNAMLKSEAFLGQFIPVDVVTTHPVYLDDFSLTQPGYNDGGPGNYILYLGPKPEIARTTETIERFLKVMAFASNADSTNTVGAALTVLLRRLWPGQKPVILVTATMSHSGKGTITDFVRGNVAKADVLYEANDWPMQSQFQRQVKSDPEIGVVLFDNVRCDSAGGRAQFIRSAFIESFITNAEITLASPGVGEAIHLDNRYVMTINTNDGRLSLDLMNRALSIHLAPKGTVHDKKTNIGNPKLEFLPKYRDQIEAELHGMIERWKVAGQTLDEDAKHSMTPWARTIGGILMVNGFKDFLGNVNARKAADDPTQEALAILGVAKPDKKLRPGEWAKIIVDEGLAKKLLPPNERDTEKSRVRATGVILSKYIGVAFLGRNETTLYHFRLEGGYKRWNKGKNPHVRYVFTVIKKEPIPTDDGSVPAAKVDGGVAVEIKDGPVAAKEAQR